MTVKSNLSFHLINPHMEKKLLQHQTDVANIENSK